MWCRHPTVWDAVSCSDGVFRRRGGDYELINLQGKISMGRWRGDGSELSIWDYPDLMEGIKRPMGGNRLFHSHRFPSH